MKVKVFGIPNCGSVKKARTFLEENNIDYDFHDYKKEGISEEQLQKWCEEFGWETVLNKKGMTWRNLDEATKLAVQDQQSAIKIMKQQTSAIKRPVIESGKGNLIGFDENQYQSNFL
ncbi:ArsC family reductase [Pedobacter cryophilus]|uniref:ArsC family reductase n=1 Tax=Pedobacter cryophilus TaxID=2571271 RepID=A0A4U1BZQ1_9SPHI|nr:ArsC family reductase [Pedobacter cryophilus]TKB98758.1 ArsC family reductase [Pedobacter cryophilus]